MLAVTLIVLTSGGVNTARLIGSAGVGLALTVLPERAARAQQAMNEPGDERDLDAIGTLVKFNGHFVAGHLGECQRMARLGLIDLPPPAVL